MFIGSDAVALAPFTRRIIYLDDGDWVVIGRHDTHFFGGDGRSVVRVPKVAGAVATATDKGSFRHFMEKELHEHPKAIKETLCRLVNPSTLSTVLPELPFKLDQIARVSISGCGSAFYAGLVGRWWLEGLARVPTDGDVASEFRYRCPPLLANSLGLLVSQSGETADTLAALRYMRGEKQHVISVVNVQESSISRESDAVLQTAAGPEIGVASTKTFTAQLSALACLAVAMGRMRGLIDRGEETRLIGALFRLPGLVASILENNDAIHAVAALLAPARDVLYLGRGNCFPIALEGALKLKEISYIHAEGYAAGEMKHGSIALIEPAVPVIGLVPSGYLFEKTASNLQEAAARGAHIIAFSDEVGVERLKGITTASVVLPDCDSFAVPFLYAVAVQMLAYEVAVLKGRDVDCPRNLAKSVTVE
jgi:glucosamine--fructose-6-phosphate aminotransferase (isomerizing)